MEKLPISSNLKDSFGGKLKAVVFDVDGTLYPNYQMLLLSIPLFVKHPRFVRAFKKMRVNVRDKVGELNIDGGIRRFQAEMISEYLGISVEDALKRIEEIIYNEWQNMFSVIRAFRGLKVFLEFLKERGYTLAVLSDFPPEKKLDFLHLSDYFDVILCSDDSGYLKPDPRAFRFLERRLGFEGNEILFVGNDYRYDIEGAKRAGMFSALKVSRLSLYGYWGIGRRRGDLGLADVVFSSYRYFLEIFRHYIIN